MKSIPVILISALFAVMPIEAKNTKTIKLKVIETSDVHGHFFPYDFMEKKPIRGTLTRANSYIKQQRKKYGSDHFLLIDNGDILQGQPCVYWSNYVMPENENIAATVINYMKYDAETVGNHDIEPGHKVYDKWIREVRCPLLGANIVKEEYKNAEARPEHIYNGLKPYSVHYKDGVKIVVIGMITPAIPNWLNKSIWKGLEFEEMTACAKKWVKYVKETEKPDLIFGLFHSGLNGGIKTAEYEEDATESVAREVPGFDIIFFGHDHQVHNMWITNKAGEKVLCIDPSCYVANVAEAEIKLTYEEGRLVKKDIKGNIVSVLDEKIDKQMLKDFQPTIDEVKNYVNQKIGYFKNPIYTRESFFGNSAFTDLIHNLQMSISKADISFNAPLAFDTTIDAGEVTQADMFKLYRFENLLFVLKMTGEEVRKHLEFSYDMWSNTMTSPNDHALRLNDDSKEDQQRTGFQYYTFNFDSACGIDYEVDLTKPDGQKVRILRMSNGEPFDEKKWYKVVMNSYRANGGGELLTRGAGIPQDSLESRVLFHTDLDQRHYLTEEIKRLGTINPQKNNNWKFVPEAWVKPALERDRKQLFGK
ncbi:MULTISPECIES: bifunctional UDP-sugar hydrolase/5'-nucleotidase [unclassified Prevotella]|uniref:bifunctional metallophosphatase/5'-nucleotidase n=1 Tax=unclassified Prevotella TaxID=2638335 RepID=UPI00048FE3D8|nr:MULTISPECIES: bifunctional UDP-sugar hydrolase/5'-nucleotidase [unclassified Prevotella]